MHTSRLSILRCVALLPAATVVVCASLRLHLKGTLPPDMAVFFMVSAAMGLMFFVVFRWYFLWLDRPVARLRKPAGELEQFDGLVERLAVVLLDLDDAKRFEVAQLLSEIGRAHV